MTLTKKRALPFLAFWVACGWFGAVAPLFAEGLFCIVDFAGKRCLYHDLATCQKALGEQGACVFNPQAMIAPRGGAPVCLVESNQTLCNYRDLPNCEREALPRRAVCIANPTHANRSFDLPGQ